MTKTFCLLFQNIIKVHSVPFLLPIFQLPFPFQFQSTGLSWATAANNSMDQGGAQKSLAEIQAEEEGQERDRQERERKEKKARQKGTIFKF